MKTCKNCTHMMRNGFCALVLDEYIKCVEHELSYHEAVTDENNN